MDYIGSDPGVSMLPNDGHSRGPPENQLHQWYAGNDGPWNPITRLITDSTADSMSKQTFNRDPSSYSGHYRQQNPVESLNFQFGVPNSDSDYGTRRSVANISVFTADVHERDQDTYSSVTSVPDFHSFHGYGNSRTSTSWTSPNSHVAESPALICPTCDKFVKTNSELKKHDLRHRRPFICSVPGCARKDGFSTTNDLDRHIKSKHPSNIQENASNKRFRCRVPGCKSKEKTWPRLDNFRSHLKRVHGNCLRSGGEFDDMVRRAEFFERSGLHSDQEVIAEQHQLSEIVQPPQPVMQESFARRTRAEWNHPCPEITNRFQDLIAPGGLQFNAFENQSMVLQHKVAQSKEPQSATFEPSKALPVLDQLPESRTTLTSLVLTPSHNINSSLKDPSQVSPPSTTTLATQAPVTDAKLTDVIQRALAGAKISDPATSARAAEHERSSLHSGKSYSRDAWTASSHTVTTYGGEPGHISADTPFLYPIHEDEAQKKAGKVLEIIRDQGFTVAKDPIHAPEVRNRGSAASNKIGSQVTCKQCGKFKGRPCELRKHLKRHSRPYGCTFATCSKRFGSKNDWKRHETSQHRLEAWRCDLAVPFFLNSSCSQVFYRRLIFLEHLKKHHALSKAEDFKNKIKTCRMPFWCGFCVKLVGFHQTGLEPWAERSDHIEDHFMGRKGCEAREIHDWVPDNPNEGMEDVMCTPYLLTEENGSPTSDSGSAVSSLRSSPSQTGSGTALHLKRHADADDMGRPPKQPRTSKNHQTVVQMFRWVGGEINTVGRYYSAEVPKVQKTKY
ncbi:C2H2 type zinc finger domain protein [Drepanopeziza brunnea f. sp. 'multigermtubi' MB_m1]|uniref:C2H2 type zinc finger domain protein n=2 Tax=Drepanopeziza brunnea f. sp. 'multigermtubi' TaxID=698441 RepID=K1X722_MARBU|nr:C2H2 type zinc finger domain protein [Drepanopeziza brunnea f. sp. 'multigermtubi' MB_m1]EKD20902.1 C2H2 type zinc finger domain protein [Drepanopeziza brunnea f. sp. 'multigermtubi' MB_m1]